MSSGSAKAIKKQAMAAVKEEMDARLDQIESFCQQQLEKQDKRARSIQGWIIQEVSVKIQNDLWNATCTVDAIVEVLAESGITIPDFAAKVDAKKTEVSARKQKEAEDNMKAALAANEAAKAAEQPATVDGSAGVSDGVANEEPKAE